jgi:hypothetical protein
MNLFELMSLNKHGDYREVLFTSALSYLLNPSNDHGLSDVFLKKILKQLFPDLEHVDLTPTVVTSEEKMENNARIDIFIDCKDNNHFVGIEAKIWDSSAENTDKNNKQQLIRYCEHLCKTYKNKSWMLVFLIPNEYSKKCIKEFKDVEKDYPGKVKLLTWRKILKNEDIDIAIINSFLDNPISTIIEDVLLEYFTCMDTKKTLLPNTYWLLESLYKILPEIVNQIPPSDKRFPSREDLEVLSVWKYMKTFVQLPNFNSINPANTTMGFSYGEKEEKAKSKYGNTLFRIRTTKKYYKNIAGKANNYPDKLEIEIWPEVYDKIKDNPDWIGLLKNWGVISVKDINGKDIKHIGSKKGKEPKVVLLSINTEKEITEKEIIDDVSTFNDLMKKGFAAFLLS